MSNIDLYQVLGLSSDASLDQIEAAYRKFQTQVSAADADPNDSRGQLVQQAYRILSDPQHRAQYDQTRGAAAQSAPPQRRQAAAKPRPEPAAVAQMEAPSISHVASLQVSAHDRVSSVIVAMLYMVGFLVLLMFLLWLTTRPSTTTAQVAVEYLDELPGGDEQLGEGRDFEEPGVEDLQDLATPDAEQLLSAVTDVASTTRASSDAMTGDVSQGHGGGDRRRSGAGGNASVPRWERWEVRFASTSLSEYAAQLQHFQIELAAAGGGRDTVDYASGLTQAKPNTRSAPGDQEKRLYMSYRRGQLKQFDRQLLGRAGVPTTGRMLLQFYPTSVEATLAGLEQRKAGGRPLKDIRKTIFAVRRTGRGYQFEVIDQQYR